MDFAITREHDALRSAVRGFAEAELAPRALELDEREEFPFDAVRKLAQLGVVGVMTPKEYGGSGMGHLARMIAIEEVSRVYAPLGFFLDTGMMGIYALQTSGGEELKRKFLPPICRGEMIVCLALTEPAGGSDPSAMQSSSRLVGNEYIINGRKAFISLVEVSDLVCLAVRAEKGFNAFLVERGTPGLEVTSRASHAGMRSIPVNELALTDCRVPRANLLGEEGRGLGAILNAINAAGRTGAAGVALGIARGSYETALKFAKERQLYGKPIAELQAIQFMLVDMDVEIEAARWLCYYAGWLLDEGKSPREIAREIARAKLYACDVANRVAPKAVQVMGGYGTRPEYQAIRRVRDALDLLTAAGTQEIMRVTIGGSIIS